MKLIFLGLGTAALSAWLDQLSKGIILENLSHPPYAIPVLSFFDLTLVFNHGVSFGFLSQKTAYGTLSLIALAAAITALMCYWLMKAKSSLGAIGLGLIIGGAIGNIIDRIRLGAVVDFLDFHWGSFSFPAFNLADTWITVGAGLVLISEFLLTRKKNDA